MQVYKIKIHHLRIPLKLRFAQANNSTKMSDSVLLEVETTAAKQGFGECCPRLYVSGEDAQGVIKALQDIREELFCLRFPTIATIEEWTVGLLQKGEKTAFVCVLELALLDAWSKTYQQALAVALGGSQKETFQYSGVVPFGKWEGLQKVLQHFQFGDVKFKAGNDLSANLLRVAQIKELFGPQTTIRLDANGAWTLAEAKKQIPALSKVGVESFEQPLAQGQEVEMACLNQDAQAASWGQIMADESLRAWGDVERLLALNACQAFNLKISKLGGILHCLRIYRLAQKEGIRCQLGAHFGETSILTSAGMVLASAAPALCHLEGGLGTHLLLEDICTPSLKINQLGRIAVDQNENKLGWGLDIDPALIMKYAQRTELWKQKS